LNIIYKILIEEILGDINDIIGGYIIISWISLNDEKYTILMVAISLLKR
jgi:drug/metabolite transporter superfamily protein YnfA